MIVPFGHGFKNVKFIQHIRLTNDYRPNDTYASIDEGDEGNDPSSVQKTYTTVDQRLGGGSILVGTLVILSGVLMNGRTPCMHLEYWIRKSINNGKDFTTHKLDASDNELKNGDWIPFALPAPPLPTDLAAILPNGIQPRDLFGVTWRPLPFSYIQWTTRIDGLVPGMYEIRARAVDDNGYKQPEPRPYQKSGRNNIGVRTVEVVVEN